MYLRGNKWSMNRRPRRRSSPWRIALLLILIGGALYIDRVIVPATPPLFVPTATPTTSPESYVNQGEQFYKEGKLSQAIDAYKEAINSDPNNPSIYITLARIQVFNGDYTDAVTNAENALLKNPNNSLAYAVRGWALSFTGDYLSAEGALKKAIEIDPSNALAHAFYAELLIDRNEEGDLQKAIQESRTAQDLTPDSLEVHRARGIVLLNSGEENLQQAITELKAAIAINDKISDLHYSLGYAYELIKENAMAEEELLTAYALKPTDAAPLIEAAKAYGAEGQFGKAVQHAEAAVKTEPTNAKYRGFLGIMYYKNQQMEQAVQSLTLAVRGGTSEDGQSIKGLPLDYGSVSSYYTYYAFALAKTSRCAEAVPIFQTLMTALPDDEIAVENGKAGIELCTGTSGTPEAGTETPEATQETTPEVTSTP